jgi:hypothetical protein
LLAAAVAVQMLLVTMLAAVAEVPGAIVLLLLESHLVVAVLLRAF